MGKVLLRRKKNNSGSTIVIVLLMTSFVLILSTLITTTTMINLRMKIAASQSTKSFYTAEEAVDEVRAALGVISVECFNKAYEEQLTQIFSSTVSSTGSTSSSIDNATANLAVRKKYTSKLLNDLQLVSGTDTEKATQIANLLNITSGSQDIGIYSEKESDKDKTTTKMCNAFISKLDDSLESKENLSVDKISKVTFTVNSTASGTGTAVTGIPVYTIQFTDCVVKYLDKSGNYSYVTFDGTVGIPDIMIDFKEDEKVGTLFFANYSLVGNKGIKVPSGSASVNGSAYAGSGKGLVIGNKGDSSNGSLSFGGNYLVCGGTVKLDGISNSARSGLTVGSSSQLWAKDIVVNDYVNMTSSGSISLQDDLTVEGDGSNVSISGSYYGFGYEDTDKAKERPDFSSAIIVNGMNSKITFGSIGRLYVAGRAYIKYPNDRPFATGESVAVDVNQEIYLIPSALLTGTTKNPTKYNFGSGSGVTFTYNITPQTFFGYNLLDSGIYETRDYLINKSGDDASDADKTAGNIDLDNSKTYYYFKFKDKASKNLYANLILNYSDSEFESYINSLADSMSGISNKNKFKEDAKTLRKNIRDSVNSYVNVGASTIESVDKSRTFSSVVPGNLGLSDDSASGSFKVMSVDRGCRFTVLSKILAPLSDDSKWYKDGEIQTELSTMDAKYANINLSRYTAGDVYGNIVNKDGFDTFTGSGAGGSAFIKNIDGKSVIVASVSSSAKLIISSGSEFKQEGNTIYVPNKQGIIVCSGDVEMNCDFNGIVLSDGIVTLKNGVTLTNTIFDDDSLKSFIDNNTITNNGTDFRDIFRYWNSKSSTKTGSLTIDDMTYKDMVVFGQWRKYYDEEKFSSAS